MRLGHRSVSALALPTPTQQQPVRFMTLDPGHFHAALIHKGMYPQVSPVIDVYAPLGFDLFEHLGRISGFNSRPENPTAWGAEVHTGPDFSRFLDYRKDPGAMPARERPNMLVKYYVTTKGTELSHAAP